MAKASTTTSTTISEKQLQAQSQTAQEIAKSEAERLKYEIEITKQEREQLKTQMQSGTVTEEQQKQYQSLTSKISGLTSTMNSYNLAASKTGSTADSLLAAAQEQESQVKGTSSSSSDSSGTSEEDQEETVTKSTSDNSNYLSSLMGLAAGTFATSIAANFASEIGGLFGPVGAAIGGAIEAFQDSVMDPLSETLQELFDGLEKGISEAVDSAASHQGTIAARLYGLQDKTSSIGDQVNAYDQILQDIQAAGFFESSYINTSDLIETIEQYAEAGVVYNLEQRAFLGTIQDQLVTTFSEAEGELRRLIKLQQTDLSMIFLGLESTINENLAEWFADTSYLTDKYDTVASNLIDAVSTMTSDDTVSFEYAVQKWLGAFYSTGATSIIDSLSTAINQLATGDVEGLASSSGMQVLITQAIEQAGESYSDWLTTGLNADRVNTLMENIVSLLQNVVSNTEGNNVTRAQYAKNVYGISIADLSAINNITTADIENLTASTLTTTEAMEAYNTQLENYVVNRVNLAQRLDTVVDNVLFSFGKDIENNDQAYMGWKIANILEGITDTSDNSSNLIETLIGKSLGLDSAANYASVIIKAKETIDFANDFTENLMGALGNFLGGSSEDDIANFQRGFTGLVNSIFDWKDILDETRGTGFVTTNATTVTTNDTEVQTGISSSTSTTSDVVGIDNTFYTLATQAASVAAATVASQESTTTAADASSIYSQLFEQQSTPVKVSLSQVETTALNQLKEELKVEVLNSIYQYLVDGTIKVSSADSTDVYSLMQSIKNSF